MSTTKTKAKEICQENLIYHQKAPFSQSIVLCFVETEYTK